MLIRYWRWLLLWLLLGAALRWLFLARYPLVQGDSFIYGDIARNWLAHGIYGLSASGRVAPTYIRLPGYPAFLAIIFKAFGVEHYTAAMRAQMAVDLAACVITAALAFELLAAQTAGAGEGGGPHGGSMAGIRPKAALCAGALAALCPFTANFVATPLTETWAIFFTALALYCVARAMRGRAQNTWWLASGLAIGAGTMMRPDGGMLLPVAGAWLVWRWCRGGDFRQLLRSGVALTLGVAAFLGPWTVRNWRTMHRFQPLAPRYANDPGDFVAAGFNRWARTWVAEYASTYYVLWNVSGEPIDPERLPQRAWGDAQERAQTAQLIAAYNQTRDLTPEIDAGFRALAAERARQHPLRNYVALPLARVADMWLRPRTELLPVEPDWWNWRDHAAESAFALFWGALNLLLLALALAGLLRRRRQLNWNLLAVMLGLVVLRSAFLGTLEGPEPRYTLECFPIVLALGGVALVSAKASGGDPNTLDQAI